MSLENRGGRWYFRFQYKGREERRPTGLEATEQNRKLAKAMEQAYRTDLVIGRTPGMVRSRRFDVAAEEFLKWCKASEYRNRPATCQRIRTSFTSIGTFFGHLNVADVRQSDVEDYKVWRLAELKVKDSTMRNDLITLGIFFKWAMGRSYCLANPTEKVKKPVLRPGTRFHIVTSEEEASYFPAALKQSKALHDLTKLMLFTGCRPEEILGAKKQQVDLRAKVFSIPGGKTPRARRDIDLVPEALEILRWRVKESADSPWLFPSPRRRGEHLTKLNAQHDEACRQSGCSFRLYDFRHTFATTCIRPGSIRRRR